MRSSLSVGIIATVAALAPAAGVAVAATDGAPRSTNKPLWQAARDYYYNPVAPADSPAMPDLKASQAKQYARRSAEAAKSHTRLPARRPGARAPRGARDEDRQEPADHRPQGRRDARRPARAAARHPGRVQPERQRRLLRLRALTTPPTRPAASPSRPARCSTARCTTRSRTRRRTAGARQQHASGCRTSARTTTSKLIYSTEGVTQQVRPDLNGGVEHQRPDGPQLLQGDVQGPVRARRAASPDWIRAALGGLVLGRHLRGRGGERPGPPGQPARHRPDGHRRRRGARQGAPELPLGRLRRRGPGRRRRRRRPVRARRRRSTTWSSCTRASTRPTAAASRARTPCGRTPTSSTRRPAATRSGHRAQGLQLHHQPEDAGDRRDRARVRPRPRPARPLRLRRPDRHRRRLLGPHEHRLAHRPAQRHPAHPHGRVEQVRARLARPEGARLRQPKRRSVTLGQASRPPKGTDEAVRVNLPAKVARGRRPHSGDNAWWSEQRPELRRRPADPHDRRAGRRRRPVLELERLHDRGAVGLRLHRGVDRRRRDLDTARGVRRGRQPGLDRRGPERQRWPTSAGWRTV